MTRKTKTVGIIAAMKTEAERIISAMDNTSVKIISGMVFTSGEISGVRCAVAVCGIGKVFAAVCAQTMILEYSPDVIINTGVAGTLTDRLSIGDIIVAGRTVQHDMDTSALGDPVGMISGINIVYLPCDAGFSEVLLSAAEKSGANCISGTVASGDRFVCDSGDRKRISDLFGASACEMEGAAIAQVCYINGTPCCVMRAISDGGDEDAQTDYPTFAKMAAERGANVVIDAVKSLFDGR